LGGEDRGEEDGTLSAGENLDSKLGDFVASFHDGPGTSLRLLRGERMGGERGEEDGTSSIGEGLDRFKVSGVEVLSWVGNDGGRKACTIISIRTECRGRNERRTSGSSVILRGCGRAAVLDCGLTPSEGTGFVRREEPLLLAASDRTLPRISAGGSASTVPLQVSTFSFNLSFDN